MLFVALEEAKRRTFRLTIERGADCAVSLDRDDVPIDGALLYINDDRADLGRFWSTSRLAVAPRQSSCGAKARLERR
jgi:urease accessory protein